MSQFHLQKFQKKHIPEFMEFVYDSYKAGNPILKNNLMTQSQFQSETLLLVTAFIEAAQIINQTNNSSVIFNSVLMQNIQFIRHEGQIVSVVFFCDLEYYIQHIEHKIGERTMKDLQQKIDKSKKGVFAVRNCVKKSHHQMKLLQAHFGLQTAHFAQNGYEYLYGTVYNQITLKALYYGGAVDLKSYIIEEKGIKVESHVIKAVCADVAQSLKAIKAKL